MPPQKKKVVICGITGSQGGWVYEALKDVPHLELVGFSRNVEAAKKKLGDAVTILEADLANLESLQKAFVGAEYVFGLTQPWNADYTFADVEGEVTQGKNLVQACLDGKVKHLVFSSSDHGEEKSGVAHVDSKMDVEDYLKASGLNYTILMPVSFADNVGSNFFPILPNGWIRGFVDGDAKLPYVACRDIGLVTKAILEKPEEYAGRSIRLIGDLVSGQDLAALVTKLRGEKFQYYAIPTIVLRLFAKEFYGMRLYFESFGRDSDLLTKARKDIENLKHIVPELSSMEDHLERQGWATRELITAEEKAKAEAQKKRNLFWLAVVTTGVAIASIVVGMKKRQK